MTRCSGVCASTTVMVAAPSVHSARKKVIRKITGRISRIVRVLPFVVLLFMASSSRAAISACPSLLVLSLLPCFVSSPAGWRGARRRSWSCRLQEASAAVLGFWLMASPPSTRSGPPTGGLAGVPERWPCSNRLSEIFLPSLLPCFLTSLLYGRRPCLCCAVAVATGDGSSVSSPEGASVLFELALFWNAERITSEAK